MPDSLWPHARLPCPSLSPRVCSDSRLLSWWCHPTTEKQPQCPTLVQRFRERSLGTTFHIVSLLFPRKQNPGPLLRPISHGDHFPLISAFPAYQNSSFIKISSKPHLPSATVVCTLVDEIATVPLPCGLLCCNELINLTLPDSLALPPVARTALKVKWDLTVLSWCFSVNPSENMNTSPEPVWWFRILSYLRPVTSYLETFRG